MRAKRRNKRINQRNSFLRDLQKKIAMAVFCFGTFVAPVQATVATETDLPKNGSVEQGTAEIKTTDNTMNIDQSTEKAVINWNSFDVGKSAVVNFNQPSVSSMTLNRITGGSLSEIAGTINAKGNILLVNPAGFLFDSGSSVNASGIIVSTAEINSDNFMRDDFMQNNNSTFAQKQSGNMSTP